MEDKIKEKASTYLAMAGLTYEQIEGVKALGYLNAPASKSHHLNYPGGLVIHSLNVTDNILKLTKTFGYKWRREESPYIIGMLHDLVKCKCYEERALGAYDYVDPGWPGHGEASLGIAAVELGIKLTYEEAIAIRHHMGLWGLSAEGIKDFNKALTNNAAPISRKGLRNLPLSVDCCRIEKRRTICLRSCRNKETDPFRIGWQCQP